MITKASIGHLEQVLGDQLGKRFITEHFAFKSEPFIFSIYPFYNSKGRRAKLAAAGIHSLAGHDGPIMLDSGGFQLIRKNEQLNPADTTGIYNDAQLIPGDTCIQLDLCPIPRLPEPERMKIIAQSGNNYVQMREAAPKQPLLFVVHGWTRKELKTSLQFVKNETPIALGSYFAMLALPANLTMRIMPGVWPDGTLQGAMQAQIIRRFLNFDEILQHDPDLADARVHVLGATGANSSHIAWFMGLEQTDSSSWRKKAAYGKIALPGVAEVGVSGRESTFGIVKWQERFNVLLKECTCPACNGHTLPERMEILKSSFEMRAVHNAWTYLEERNIARELVGTTRYLPFLQKRFARSHFWKLFLRKIRGARSQTHIEQYLRLNLRESRMAKSK